MAVLNVARRLAERWARGKSVTRKVCVEGKTHRIKLSPDAQLKYLKLRTYSQKNESLIQLAETQVMDGFNVWDIGASCGVFSLAAAIANGSGKVLSVDADSWQLSLIEETKKFKENRGFEITTLCCAVSDRVDLLNFSIAERGRASNSLSMLGEQAQMGGSRSEKLTTAVDLDFLLAKTFEPDFIKMDIEGAELLAVDGGETLFREIRPTVFMEVRETSQVEIVERFTDLGYVATSLAGDPLIGKNPNSAWDILFVPNASL